MFIEFFKNLKHIFDNEDDTLNYLIENKFVNKFDNCNKCNHDTKLSFMRKTYVCKYYKCRKALSLSLKGTIFNNLKLPLNIQLHILFLFLGKAPSSFISSSLQIDKNSVSRYNKVSRKYIKDKELINPRNKIGEGNEIIEIDKTKITKRKYNKDHKVEGAWIQ